MFRLGFLLLVLVAISGSQHTVEDARQPTCWVFTHLAKTGGVTVAIILRRWASAARIENVIHYDTDAWKQGSSFAKQIAPVAGRTVVYGGYTEALRPYLDDGCRWFTVLRHPVSRLVSAYFYCKKSPRDQCCASIITKASNVDFHTFAEHWGNYGVRQFALAFQGSEPVLKSEIAAACPQCPGWYLLKTYLRENFQETIAPDGGLKHFDPVLRLVDRDYAAVGILEKLNSSMHLFNHALQMPGVDWPSAVEHAGVKNSGNHDSEERYQISMSSWTDLRVKMFIQLDLLLYEHAVNVNARQLAMYGLS